MANGDAKRAGRRGAWALPRLATLLAALAVFAQLVALPYHRPSAQGDLSIVAAELRATFGKAAVLCTQGDDGSSPATHEPGGCDAGCPLCQFASQVALLAPPPPALPVRLAIADGPPPAHGDFLLPRARAIRFAQPRAPPFFA